MKVNDTVRVISGDNKGKEAKIVKIDRKNGKACLEGIGVVERHMKKSYTNPKGGKKTIHVGIDMSNLKLIKAGEPAKKAEAKADKKAAKKAKKGAK
ncbi:50S ribosomal protein L24 [Candidatus Saccharibacteria bacterium]|nr:50S ribosomal protein L24 [Candidatus Saccharibacteria bacterium]